MDKAEIYNKKFKELVETLKAENKGKTISIHYSQLAIALGISPSSANQWLRTLCLQNGYRYVNGRCIITEG
jgi:hypothetical protein